jgi:hypothetical protein
MKIFSLGGILFYHRDKIKYAGQILYQRRAATARRVFFFAKEASSRLVVQSLMQIQSCFAGGWAAAAAPAAS